jgi:glutathione peroxidase
MFSKIEVNGDGAAPLYRWLKAQEPGDGADIRWNFEKFLVGPRGRVVTRWASSTTPAAIGAALEGLR